MTSLADTLFSPKRVAVIGASGDPLKPGGRPVRALLDRNFPGRIYPVNPARDEIAGLKAYKSVRDLPEAPDLGLVLVSGNRVIDEVRALAAVGAHAVVVLASGFGEAGPEGLQRQKDLIEAAGKMRLLGPNTIGLVNLTDDIPLSASAALDVAQIPTGKIALISQSGGIMGSLLSRGAAQGIGFSKLVATGNEADLTASDFIELLADDASTQVISLYLETIRDAPRFRAAVARAMAAGKTVVAYKVGRSEAGARSAASHTGALAGSDDVYDAFFEQIGVIRARTFHDLLGIPTGLAARSSRTGKRVAIVTSTGGAATVLADNIALAGLEIPPPDVQTARELATLDLPDAVLDQNPVDVTLAGLKDGIFDRILSSLMASDTYDAIVAVIGSSSIAQPHLVSDAILRAKATSDKPILAYVSPHGPAILAHLNGHGIPAFAVPEGCAAALRAIARDEPLPNDAPASCAAMPDLGLPTGPLNEAEAKSYISRFGIAIPKGLTSKAVPAQETIVQDLQGQVVVKILSRHIAHKTDFGGVRVGIEADDISQVCTEMLTRVKALTDAPLEGFLVEELAPDGVEMILGFNRDPQIGPYILLGAGGVATELYRDVALGVLPVGPERARTMISQLRSAALLRGFRGRPFADEAALVAAIVSFSKLVEETGDHLVDAEINPLRVLPEGEGVVACDCVMRFRKSPPRSPAEPSDRSKEFDQRRLK